MAKYENLSDIQKQRKNSTKRMKTIITHYQIFFRSLKWEIDT